MISGPSGWGPTSLIRRILQHQLQVLAGSHEVISQPLLRLIPMAAYEVPENGPVVRQVSLDQTGRGIRFQGKSHPEAGEHTSHDVRKEFVLGLFNKGQMKCDVLFGEFAKIIHRTLHSDQAVLQALKMPIRGCSGEVPDAKSFHK